MTLKTRNQTIILINIFQVICTLCALTLFIYSIINNSFETIFGCKFLSRQGFSFFHSSNKAVIVGLLFLQIFSTVSSFHLYYNYEKTQAPLIILFCIFLLGVTLESSKIFIALFNLRESYSQLHLWLGNVSFGGKLISLFSFFLISINSKESQKLNIEIDIIILITICVWITVRVPLNTVGTTSTFGITPGFSPILYVLYIVTFLLTIITFIFTYFETENKNLLKFLVSYIFMSIGKHLITDYSILVVILIGIIMLVFGTSIALKSLHKLYSWE